MGLFNKIPFAVRMADNRIVSIEEVPRGLACECRCPSCDARLVARKGDVNEHHFAHHDSSVELCEFAFETSIRLMLLEILGQIRSISTPDYLWCQKRIIEGRTKVDLIFDLDLSQANQSPHFVYKIPQSEDYRIGLYLPAAGQNAPPVWLDEFIAKDPRMGILQLNYSAIGEQLFRDHNNEYIAKLISIVQTSSPALRWLYHPRYQAQVARYQQQEEEKRQQELKEQQARLQQYRILKAQQEEQALQAQSRLQQAYQILERRPYGSDQDWTPLSSADVGEHTADMSHTRYCRICGEPLDHPSPTGYCNNARCNAARRKSGIRF